MGARAVHSSSAEAVFKGTARDGTAESAQSRAGRGAEGHRRLPERRKAQDRQVGQRRHGEAEIDRRGDGCGRRDRNDPAHRP